MAYCTRRTGSLIAARKVPFDSPLSEELIRAARLSRVSIDSCGRAATRWRIAVRRLRGRGPFARTLRRESRWRKTFIPSRPTTVIKLTLSRRAYFASTCTKSFTSGTGRRLSRPFVKPAPTKYTEFTERCYTRLTYLVYAARRSRRAEARRHASAAGPRAAVPASHQGGAARFRLGLRELSSTLILGC